MARQIASALLPRPENFRRGNLARITQSKPAFDRPAPIPSEC
jgi:hypothetical protein